ncbi:hypothetical protein K9N68_38470 (plasmid) [Kovacikia minuta CCNUW1]|uniref:hypothetical protein n=1 Tax=Kovacikia minuta TaxID=2931930 RepID=UPI001CCF73D3|nr:hypothetical protein [Kovacikia minuta]UBF30075.1 hypothetical protein K9N68_38470 [Kovacikia minuta CCNUW1]
MSGRPGWVVRGVHSLSCGGFRVTASLHTVHWARVSEEGVYPKLRSGGRLTISSIVPTIPSYPGPHCHHPSGGPLLSSLGYVVSLPRPLISQQPTGGSPATTP